MADQDNNLRVRLVTPERILFESNATAVELPSKTGYFEVLYGHAPLMAELGAGDVRIHTGAGIDSSAPDSTRYNVSGDSPRYCPTASRFSLTTRSSPKRSTPSAPSSSSTAATSLERSRRKQTGIRRSAPRHQRSRSQAGLGSGKITAPTNSWLIARRLAHSGRAFSFSAIPSLTRRIQHGKYILVEWPLISCR